MKSSPEKTTDNQTMLAGCPYSRGLDYKQNKFAIPRVYCVGHNKDDDDSGKSSATSQIFEKINYTQLSEEADTISGQPGLKKSGSLLSATAKPKKSKLDYDKRLSLEVQSKSHYWIKLTVHVHGNLKHELFVQTLTLLMNQAIEDYLVELHLNRTFMQKQSKTEPA